MSDCKCGHGAGHHHNYTGSCSAQRGSCFCTAFAPARQVSEREVSHEERMEGCSAYAESVLAARQVSVTDTIEGVLGEHTHVSNWWKIGGCVIACACGRYFREAKSAIDEPTPDDHAAHRAHIAAEVVAALGPATDDRPDWEKRLIPNDEPSNLTSREVVELVNGSIDRHCAHHCKAGPATTDAETVDLAELHVEMLAASQEAVANARKTRGTTRAYWEGRDAGLAWALTELVGRMNRAGLAHKAGEDDRE